DRPTAGGQGKAGAEKGRGRRGNGAPVVGSSGNGLYEAVLPKLLDVRGLRAAGPLDDFELHLLTFLEGLEAVLVDGRVVDEYVGAVRPGDEPVARLVAEPLHGSAVHLRTPNQPRQDPLRGLAHNSTRRAVIATRNLHFSPDRFG